MTIDRKRFKNLFSLTGKTAVITGTGGLLGEVYAHALAAAGAAVVLTDLKRERCDGLAACVTSEWGVQSIAVGCDVTQRNDWERLREILCDRFTSVDILVNNAGFTNASRIEGYSDGFDTFPDMAWKSILDVNLTGVFMGCQVIGKMMTEKRTGSIINVASQYGVVSPNHTIYDGTGVSQPVAYSVSKAGVIALTRYLATCWGETGVRVNSLTPGGVFDKHTDPFLTRFSALNPMGRMCDRDELAGAVVFLASDAASYMTGHNLVVDGGWTVW
ncbi:SDR family oxidoreductase [bacterium]|nr:SDR family oxidoreductase [candidate division CSSED10-310 bacterium]